MRNSLKGGLLPETREEAMKLVEAKALKFTHCCDCGAGLHLPAAASTRTGWAETQISGMCEPCFDRLEES